MSDVGAVHYFQLGAVVEGDELAGELFCRIMINRVNYPAEILSVEFTHLVDIFYPDGNMFDFHNNPTIIYTKREGEEIKFSTSIHIINVIVGISLSIL